jgi:alpha-N-arabinofuranosidase
MVLKKLHKLICVSLFLPSFIYASECVNPDAKSVSVIVDTTRLIRTSVPQSLFGFNIPWRDFQIGYVRNNKVREELIDYMKPFSGAVYRYPGGTPSDWFEWKKSIGPMSSRSSLHADFNRYAVPSFGLDEFTSFVKELNARAIITLNLVGPYKAEATAQAVTTDATDLINYIRSDNGFGCVSGDTCPMLAWELGNELDGNPFYWTAQHYVERVKPLVSAVSASIPDVEWIANGKTSPWDSGKYLAFNDVIAVELSSWVKGIAFHPYYDGMTVPSIIGYMKSYAATWSSYRSDASIHITEHARWPTVPAVGDWKTTWYQATGIGGAISSADFILSLIPREQVKSAVWHALGVEGPWQLIRLDKNDDSLYPSPVYLGLLLLRQAFLADAIYIKYTQPSNITYTAAGYDLRMVAMHESTNNMASILGVNRNPSDITLQVNWSGQSRNAGESILRSISATSLSIDNTDEAKNNVVINTQTSTRSGLVTDTTVCIPGNSVFSIIEP